MKLRRCAPRSKNPFRRAAAGGIALFILMTSLVVMSIAMKELFQLSSGAAERSHNSMDRIQAIYLARSTLNLSRFFIAYDRILDQNTGGKGGGTDTLSDLWAKPIPFPVPVELLMGGGVKESESENADAPAKPATKKSAAKSGSDSGEKIEEATKDALTKCKDFFDDFAGTAASTTTDLSAELSLNDLAHASNLTFEAMVALLSPTPEFTQMLSAKGLSAEILARQLRDYADRDEIEKETNAQEDGAYNAAQLTYKPKNRPFMIMDELKLIPGIDDEIYEYLTDKVCPYYLPLRTGPDRININTASKDVFQAMLKNISNPEEIAAKFIKDRKEKQRVYKDEDLAATLQSALSLDKDNIRLSLLTGKSDAFKIETEASVNQTELKLETIVSRASGAKKMEPIVFMRVTP